MVPGARAGRRLTELLLEQAERRGTILTPPGQVTTPGHLPELLYRATRPLAHPATARAAFARVLQDMEGSDLSSVFPTLPVDTAGWGALAEIVYRLHDELGAHGLNFGEVARRFGSHSLYDDAIRWQTLARVGSRYRQLLDAAGMCDQGRARLRALDGDHLRNPGDVWLLGVVEMPRLARRMLEGSGAPVRSLIHAPDERADGFDELGCVRSEGWGDFDVPLRDEHIKVVFRPTDQAAVVASILRDTEGRYSAEEIVVGVPHAEVVPYLEQRLAESEVPHRHAAGTPLSASGPFRLLQAVADYLDGRRFRALADLLRHPDLAPLRGAADQGGTASGALEAADRYYSRHLPLEADERTLVRGERGEGMAARVIELEESLQLERFAGRRSLAVWMPAVLGLLVSVYGREPLARSELRTQHLLEACLKIKKTADVLARLPERLDSRVAAHEAIHRLLSELRTESIAPDPEREAVELVGWLELPLDDAPLVIVTGFNEPHVPETMASDAFLPGALRTRLGLPDDRQRYCRDAYLLTAMLHSHEQVHLVAGRSTAAGDPLRPSRLLFAAPDRIAAQRILRYLGQEEHAGASAARSDPAPASPVSGAPNTSAFQTPPEPKIDCTDAVETVRVSDFRSILHDPYRFALERLLGLHALDDSAREMDALQFGSLAHTVLERFGGSDAVDSDDEQQITAVLDRILDDAFGARFGSRPVPAVQLQRLQLRARLGAFAAWHAGWVGEGWRVVGVEKAPEKGLPFVVDGEPVLLRGRIDRIDYHADSHRWMLFDYKTSENATSPEKTHRTGRKGDKKWVDLQLPLYRLLLAAIKNEDGSLLVPAAAQREVGLGYIVLPRSLPEVGPLVADWSAEELSRAEEVAGDVIRILRRGVFEFDRDSKGFGGKWADPFDALLGRKELPTSAEVTDEQQA